MKKILPIFVAAALLGAGYPQPHTVTKVVDGDTLQLDNGARVRLIGIDAPETRPNEKAVRDSRRTGKDLAAINEDGRQAATALQRYVRRGTKVTLEFDVEKRDKYGRLLAYVYVPLPKRVVALTPPVSGWVDRTGFEPKYFLNATMVYEGYASPLTIPPNVRHAGLFKQLYQEARLEKRGLWKDSGPQIKTTKNKRGPAYAVSRKPENKEQPHDR